MIERKEIVDRLLRIKGWPELNNVQKKALDAGVLNLDANFVIIAPTASGKTGVAELAMLQAMENNLKVIYAVPTNALINAKLTEFRDLAKQQPSYNVKRSSSNYSQWKKADLVITTFESLYRACLRSKYFLNDFELVIVDEFHILYDPFRGYVLEKALTILKESNIRIFCLSATFEDRQEIGEWLNAKVVYIPRKERPIQITHDIIDLSNVYPARRTKLLCETLIKRQREPYLIFCRTKDLARSRAMEMCKHISGQKNDKEKIRKKVKRLISKEELPLLEEDLCSCLIKGVGFHHSALPNKIRNFVANLFINRKIDYLFCTTGLAYGINFPAKAVVVSDSNLYNPDKRISEPIAQYLYSQMAGRAGRPQYDKEGFCYWVVKKSDDLVKFEDYKKGNLPRAISQINNDDYFFKAILELIHSDRTTDKEIIDFFKNSLANFQAKKDIKGLIPFNLNNTIQTKMRKLNNAGILERVGINSKLTGFGKVIINYLFKGFYSPDIADFVSLKQYLERKKKVEIDFELIYFLSRRFKKYCTISKQANKSSEEVLSFLRNRGITEKKHSEYSAYVVYKKWIENIREVEIEDACKVYSSNLSLKMGEMYKLLNVYEDLARNEYYSIPDGFQIVKERIRYGVLEDELSLVKIRGIGRDIARSIRIYCYDVLQRNLGYKGYPIDILKKLLEEQGEESFLQIHIQYVKYVGMIRAKKLLSFIKNKKSVDE